MKVNVIVNTIGSYMSIPRLSLAVVWIKERVENEIAQAVARGDSKFDITISVKIDSPVGRVDADAVDKLEG